MEWVLVTLAALTLCYLLFTLIEFIIGFNHIKSLQDTAILAESNLPFISIILSALNEERELHAALLTLINQAYPRFEIIAINDRSTDKTADILQNLAEQYPFLRVHHIAHLPEGWLGKNHALHIAANMAKGEWLLFTDADVMLHPQTLAKAVSYAQHQQLDHLTICEHHIRKRFWLKILFLGQYIGYCMSMKPWRIPYRWSKRSLGHGAFNLVKRSAYERAGGHAAISMECLDDLKLGEIIKHSGHKQGIVEAQDFVAREWYGSLGAMIEGLKKNSFAVFNYRLSRMLSDCSLAALIYFWPFAGALFFSGTIRWLNMINILLTFVLSAYVAKRFRLAIGFALFYPISIAILFYTLGNSAWATYKYKGVIWRGTHYPLKKLKNHKVQL